MVETDIVTPERHLSTLGGQGETKWTIDRTLEASSHQEQIRRAKSHSYSGNAEQDTLLSCNVKALDGENVKSRFHYGKSSILGLDKVPDIRTCAQWW